MLSDEISLRGLELLEQLERSGSMQEAARAVGLSAPAASRQLKNLEKALGHQLIEHGRRPLELSSGGKAYLVHVRAALNHMRQGASELSLVGLNTVKNLRIGIIDDFDSEVTPLLTVALARILTPTQLSLVTAPSLRIVAEIATRNIELGIASRPFDLPIEVDEIPVLRDPFILAAPRGYLKTPPSGIEALEGLPFLRYEKNQLLARQISTHLSRLRLAPKGWIEVDSNQTIFSLIASGSGWAITTPVGYLRAQRFHDKVDLFPLPYSSFSRTISLFHRSEWIPGTAEIMAERLRNILKIQVVDPGLEAMPWLKENLAILSA
jgi:molybdate transport repressor ModE-like protein